MEKPEEYVGNTFCGKTSGPTSYEGVPHLIAMLEREEAERKAREARKGAGAGGRQPPQS